MFVIGLGTATPPRRYTQAECWEALLVADCYLRLSERSKAIVDKVLHSNNGISTRYLALDPLSEVSEADPDALHRRFVKHAPRLAALAGERALADAGARPAEIDALIISTCTGYLCPGLTSYVIEGLKLRQDAIALDLVGQGCGAALPNWRTAEALLASQRCQRVLSICVEVCSAAFYLDDDPGVLISACLFGDGAGAAVLAGSPQPDRRVIRWLDSGTLMDPSRRDLLRFEQRNGLLRNILTRPVPQLAADYADSVLKDVLGRNTVSQGAVSTWIWHAGGRDVLLALQKRLGLSPAEFRLSSTVLNEFGNLSSAFVYFVLQAAINEPAPPGLWWMSSFGAGFSCHGALLHVI